MKVDFSGYATKAGLECADGLTIGHGAFAHQDGAKVPLVYQHVHDDPTSVVGHAILEARPDGMYAKCFFNSTEKGKHSKEMVIHGDVESLSIFANKLVRDGKKVMHGMIREVSLVLAGANPGAKIDFVSIQHGDYLEELETDAVIYTGEKIVHEDAKQETQDPPKTDDGGEMTIKQALESMTAEQQAVVNYIVGQLIEGTEDEGDLKQDDTSDDPNSQEDKKDMGNAFDQTKKDGGAGGTTTLSHSDLKGIFATAMEDGTSTKKAVEAYAVQHGIVNIEALFPEAKALTTTPTWDKRRTEWVAAVFGAAQKSPFSKIKTWTADVTYEEARARGYITGDLKEDAWFTISSRETGPQTVYIKQSIDRDDYLDITDFDVVAFKKVQMRFQLEEDLARAILIGDGRLVNDPNKIKEDRVRPILTDHSYYTKTVALAGSADVDQDILDMVDAVVEMRYMYKGSGTPTFFTSPEWLGKAITIRDADGHRLYKTVADLAAEMMVDTIVPVEFLSSVAGLVGIMVNMNDYTVGADKGGQTTMFEDFDIDYNKQKYLLETRVSGCLTKPSAAMVFYNAYGTSLAVVTPTAPDWDPDTFTVSIPVVAGVTYYDEFNVAKSGDVVLSAGTHLRLFALPNAGKVLAPVKNQWSFLRA